MKTNQLTPEQSLELITQVIQEAKSKFEENGVIYVFWGVLIAIASFGQYYLLSNGHQSINYYPYALMPLGAIITWIYVYKKEDKHTKPNQVSRIVGYLWTAVSLNLLIVGCFMGAYLKVNLIPILLILMGIGIWVSGGAIRSKVLMASGVLINIAAFICFQIDWLYQPLLMGILAIFAILIPGIILMNAHKKQQHV